jgi:protein-disulfide isomerase
MKELPMIARRRFALHFAPHSALAALAPLALALAACGGTEETAGGTPSGEPIAPISAPAGQSWVDTAAVTPQGGYVIGNPEAPIKLVEYASHTCSHCATFSQEASGPIEEYVASGRVSYEIRNQVHDAIDLTIAMLVRCGSPQSFHPLASQTWANFDQILGNAQANSAALERATQGQGGPNYPAIAEAAGLLDFFAARGISRDQAIQCLSDPAVGERIVQNSNEQSNELGVTGTPTFFINGSKIDGTNWSSVEAALQQAGAR